MPVYVLLVFAGFFSSPTIFKTIPRFFAFFFLQLHFLPFVFGQVISNIKESNYTCINAGRRVGRKIRAGRAGAFGKVGLELE